MNDKNALTGKHTLVEEGTELTGTIKSSVPIVVMGKIEGDIAGPEIRVAATGVVAGNVKVQRLRSEGELAGVVEAEAVQISGRVRDRTVIRARTLEMTVTSQGMEVQFGACELQVGDEPNKAAAIAAATAAAATPPDAVRKPDETSRKRGTQPPPLG
ncbi:MAG TPA: polymer-forming cytoskeletal protein [Kofleriaceae bacterium]|nr:polymer-forming cytoskeletal protein [Kofleriaceae bacterium]